MEGSSLKETIQKVTTLINALKEDLGAVKTPCIKANIKNEIYQQSVRLSRLITMNNEIAEKKQKGDPEHAQKKEPQQGQDTAKPRRRYCKVIKDGSSS
jgi:hypothetical protein